MKYDGMPKNEFKYKGMYIHCISKAPQRLYSKGKRKIGPTIRFSLSLFRKFGSDSYDIIDANQTPFIPIIILWLWRLLKPNTRLVATWHEYWSLAYWREYLGSIQGVFGFAVQQLTTKMPEFVICVSEPTARDVQSKGGVSNIKISVIWNGVNIEELLRIRSHATSTPRRIIFVGRLIPEKRVDLFIRFCKRLQQFFEDLHVVIVGDGPERQQLENVSKDLNVQFTGFLSAHKDVLEEIAKSSLFISFSEREGFNISALEACQLGIPTYVRFRYFDHENLHIINNIKSIVQKLGNVKIQYTNIDQRYSWDNIAKQTEMRLVELRKGL